MKNSNEVYNYGQLQSSNKLSKKGKQRPKGESLGFRVMRHLEKHTIVEKNICLEICFTATMSFHARQTAQD